MIAINILLIITYSIIMFLYLAPIIITTFTVMYAHWDDTGFSRKSVVLWSFALFWLVATILTVILFTSLTLS